MGERLLVTRLASQFVMKLFPWLLFLMATQTMGEWTPLDKPDPTSILQEAVADTDAKRYADALAKHVWFHHHALEHRPSMYGVRLSFALTYWKELGQSYPPAMDKLKEIRELAKESVLQFDGSPGQEDAAFEKFHDFMAINRTLKEYSETTALFLQLEQYSSPLTKRVFDVAFPSLLSSKEYKLCGKYLVPQTAFPRYVERFKELKKHNQDARFAGVNMKQVIERQFSQDLAILVAVLVVNNRNAEAVSYAALAKHEWDDAAFHNSIDQALDGVFPK